MIPARVVARAAIAGLCAAGLLLGGAAARAADAFAPPPPAPPLLGSCRPEVGGFHLPGTDGCLRISGFVAAEGAAATGGGWSLASPALAVGRTPGGPIRSAGIGSNLSHSALGVGTRLSADVRLPTEYGPVRAYLSLRGVNGLVGDRGVR